MKRIKRLLIIPFMMVSLITFSSCSFITDFLNSVQSEAEKSKEETTKKEEPTKTDDTTPTTSTSTDESESTGDTSSTTTTEDLTPVVIDELDYGYADLENLSLNYENLQKFYKDVKHELSNFYASTKTLELEKVTFRDKETNQTYDEYYYFIGDVSFLDYKMTENEALAVVKEVLLDYPEYYFVANEALTSYSSSNGIDTKKSIRLVCDSDFYKGNDRVAYNQKIEEFSTAVSTLIESRALELERELTNKEKVRLIHDYITSHAQYAYKEDGKTPDDSSLSHCMLGIIDNGKGVCESYTELFTYLLKKNNIPAITVAGKGYTSASATGENHAWNYVNIDGYWYGFDVTWDDTTNTNDYYGNSESKFKNIHVDQYGNKYIKDSSRGAHEPNKSDIGDRLNYLYPIPQLSGIDLTE